jgi:hypothetical protein
MKAKFYVTQDEMVIYKSALRDKLIVTLPGVQGKHMMNSLDVSPISDNSFELTVEYGKEVKRGKSNDRNKPATERDI